MKELEKEELASKGSKGGDKVKRFKATDSAFEDL